MGRRPGCEYDLRDINESGSIKIILEDLLKQEDGGCRVDSLLSEQVDTLEISI